MDFTALLLTWFGKNRRDLPWKQTTDPYKIWLSEIILQQTRVDQGHDYYLRFVKAYPRVNDLAAAPVDEVLKLWQGLGYYSRARNLHHTAQVIVEEYNGVFPQTAAALMALKGVGAYTAAAIASFAHGEPVAALDGNAYRILSRVFGVEAPIDSAEGKKEIQALAETLLPPQRPADFNQAMMDFGSLVCTPKQAQCMYCPMQDACYALRNGRVYALPVKRKKVAVRTRYFHYFLLSDGVDTYIHKRPSGDIWEGLYEFPLIETEGPVEADEISGLPAVQQLLGESALCIMHHSSLVKHQLTHQTLWTRFYAVQLEPGFELPPAPARPGALQPEKFNNTYIKVPLVDLERYSIPRLIDAFLEKHSGTYLFQKK